MAWYGDFGEWPGNNWWVGMKTNPQEPLFYMIWDAENSWGEEEGAHIHARWTYEHENC